MKAMVFAAGLGTRLRPITNSKPKALVEVNGRPLLEIVMARLIEAGATSVIINLHHFPEQIKTFVRAKNSFGIRVEFSEERSLLDTGGGLKKAEWFLRNGSPFLLHNVDIVSDIDLNALIRAHDSEARLATLAVNRRKTSRYFIFDEQSRLCGWKSLKDGVEKKAREPEGRTVDLAFCGIHVISPRIFDKLTERGAFSIIDSYLRLAAENEIIRSFEIDSRRNTWRDVGKLSEIDH